MNQTQKKEALALKAQYERVRYDLNLTHEKLADAMGVKQGSISHFLNGRIPIPLMRAQQFAEILGIEISSFSERLAFTASQLGVSLGDTVYVDVVVIDMETPEIIDLILKKKLFIDKHKSDLIYWPEKHSAKTFAMKAKGAEAYPAINEGSLAFVDTEQVPTNNDMALIIKNGKELLFCQIKGNGYAELPNHNFPDRIFKLNKFVKVVGKVIGVQNYL